MKPAHILVVEDNEDLRMLYQQALTIEGYNVWIASHGQEALDLLRNLSTSEEFPSVIFLDLMMPVMNGWEFLEARAQDERLAKIPVVVCSASKDNFPQGTRLLRKPVDLDMLLAIASEYAA